MRRPPGCPPHERAGPLRGARRGRIAATCLVVCCVLLALRPWADTLELAAFVAAGLGLWALVARARGRAAILMSLGLTCGLALACGGAASPAGTPTTPTSPTPATTPPTSEPIAIDTPGATAYKGLPLGLVDRGQPVVTPVDGVIGVVCIGMSNGAQECADFIREFDARRLSGEVNPAIRVVNCAVGSHAIERWNDPAFDATLWDACLREKLPARNVRPDQVRVVWHKAARQFTAAPSGSVLPTYPDQASDYFRFIEDLTRFGEVLPRHLLSVQAVYVTSRSYGGFAATPQRGEPLSYEEGHALNQWLASRAGAGPVWYGWGPYIWAPDCASGRTNGSGVCYARSDYQTDGVHPASGALTKITRMLHDRWSRHDWYRR